MAKKKNLKSAPVRAAGKPIDDTFTETYRGGVTINPLAVLKEELTFTNGGTEDSYIPATYDFIIDRPDLPKKYEVKGDWNKEYIEKPTASKIITENGTYDVTNFASAEVSVPTEGTPWRVKVMLGLNSNQSAQTLLNKTTGELTAVTNFGHEASADYIFAEYDGNDLAGETNLPQATVSEWLEGTNYEIDTDHLGITNNTTPSAVKMTGTPRGDNFVLVKSFPMPEAFDSVLIIHIKEKEA